MIYNLDNIEYEKKIYSSGCITRYDNGILKETKSKEGCYIIYDLYEPSLSGFYDESYKTYYRQRMIIGKYSNNMENKVYRYTGVYFFGKDFYEMLPAAEEMELEFHLSRVAGQFLGTDGDIDETIFKNNILIKGHTFESYKELSNEWNDRGYNEFKFHTSCPYLQSIYNNIKTTLKNNELTVTFRIDNALIKEFLRYGVKGFQLYCHNSINGYFGACDDCKIKITKFKNLYNNYFVSDNSAIIKNTKTVRIYEDPYHHIGNINNYRFYFFNKTFEEALNRAEEMTITFNISWTSPSKQQANALDMNINYVKEGSIENGIQLKGHTFENLDEVKLCKTREEVFADTHSISIYNSFKKALKEGHTTYTFTLNKNDIDTFLKQKIKGFYIGLTPNGNGMWRMSDVCNISITKYREEYKPLFIETDNNSWINMNVPCFIGSNPKVGEGFFSGHYFFNEELYNSLHNKNIENITVRILFADDFKPINGIYQLCIHNYTDIDDIRENYNDKYKILGMIKLTDFESDHYDMILSRNQINLLKDSKGVSIYCKNNEGFFISLNKIIVFVDYEEIEDESYYEREFNNISFKSFIRETKTLYDNKFICGNNSNDYSYMPFAFIGDNFKNFINNERIASIVLTVKTSAPINIDGRAMNKDVWFVDFFCHNVSTNKENYESYKYTDYLFTANLSCSQSYVFQLNDEQFEILKNNVGIGAVIRNNYNNEIFAIDSIKINVTYIR